MRFSKVIVTVTAALLLGLSGNIAYAVDEPQSSAGATSDAAAEAPTDNAQPNVNEPLPFKGKVSLDWHQAGQKDVILRDKNVEVEFVLTSVDDAPALDVRVLLETVKKDKLVVSESHFDCVTPVSTEGACDSFEIIQANGTHEALNARWQPRAGDRVVVRGTFVVSGGAVGAEGSFSAVSLYLMHEGITVTAPVRGEATIVDSLQSAEKPTVKPAQSGQESQENVQTPQSEAAKSPKWNPKLADTGADFVTLLALASVCAGGAGVIRSRRNR